MLEPARGMTVLGFLYSSSTVVCTWILLYPTHFFPRHLHATHPQENDLLLRDNQELARRVEALEEERLHSGGHRSYSERRRATTGEGRSST